MPPTAITAKPRRGPRSRFRLGGLLLGLWLGMNLAGASEVGDDPPPGVTLPTGQGFALVELFTSEGCSSCPPADRLLARLRATARQRRQPLETLSFHVDYWNHLGWRDPFSSTAASQRQRWYAQRIEPHSVYTPQMVVNGVAGFVGADAVTADSVIEAALMGGSGEGGLGLAVDPAADRTLTVTYRLPPAGLPAGSALVLAWAQDAGRGQPRRGENAGRTLDHVGVVRDFRVLGGDSGPPVPAAGRVVLSRPAAGPGRVVGFVQERASARVRALVGVDVR